MIPIRFRLLLLLALLPLSRTAAQPLRHAALVEGADLVLSVNLAALHHSPFMQTVLAQQPPDTRKQRAAQQRLIRETTGLEEADILHYMLTVDLHPDLLSFSLNPATPGANPAADLMAALQFVLAVEVKRSMTLDDLQKGIQAVQADSPTAPRTESATLGGRPVLKLTPGTEEISNPIQNAYISLSDSGRIVLLTLNERSLTDAHARLAQSRSAAPSPEVLAALQTLAGSDIQLAFVLPPEARQTLADSVRQLSLADPMAGMMAAPFAGLASFTLSGRAAETLDLDLRIDTGHEQAARQLAAMIQSFGSHLGGPAAPFARNLTPTADATLLRLHGSLTPADMRPADSP